MWSSDPSPATPGRSPACASARSPYYPPRARWTSRFFFLQSALRRRLHLEGRFAPWGIGPGGLVLCCLLPGYAFFAGGRRRLGWWVVASYVGAGLLTLLWLGHLISGIGAGVMLALHALCVSHLIDEWRGGLSFRQRVLLGLLTPALLAVFLYLPVRHWIETRCVVPLQLGGRVLIVRAGVSPRSVHVGDVVVYRLDPLRSRGVWCPGGHGYGIVDAVAGDQITFAPSAFRVNGAARPARPLMPAAGSRRVPERHWFIWPDSTINLDQRFGEGYIAAVQGIVDTVAMVPESHLVGKPLKRWFWRRQLLP